MLLGTRNIRSLLRRFVDLSPFISNQFQGSSSDTNKSELCTCSLEIIRSQVIAFSFIRFIIHKQVVLFSAISSSSGYIFQELPEICHSVANLQEVTGGW
jgi:hypothetical protein